MNNESGTLRTLNFLCYDYDKWTEFLYQLGFFFFEKKKFLKLLKCRQHDPTYLFNSPKQFYIDPVLGVWTPASNHIELIKLS